MCTFWDWIKDNHDQIQTVVFTLGTVAAFAVIKHNAIVSRREATIEMVNEQFGDEAGHYEEFKTLFLDLEQSGQNLLDYTVQTPENTKGRDIILRQLNRYELVALAISKGVFSEAFYKRWFYSQLMHDFVRLWPLIASMRRHFENEAYFCEFANLAARWDRKKHPVKHPPKWKIMWWVLINKRLRARSALKR